MQSAAFSPILADLQRETDPQPLRVEGTVPPELNGTLYRNGPGLFHCHGKPYRHWFDGDGAVSACRLREGRVSGAVHLVQSSGLQEERRLGRAHFDSYGTDFASFWRRFRGTSHKNVANTSVMLWQGRLLALMEAAAPTELHPDTLATLGETDLDGAIIETFSAHPHEVPQRQASYNFGVRYGRIPQLDLYELPKVGKARRLASIPLPWAAMVHDFVVTQKYMVFFIPPVCLSLANYFLRSRPFGESLQWQPQRGTRVLVVPIDAPDQPVWMETDSFFQWHFCNGYEADDATLVVDVVRYPDFYSNQQFSQLLAGTVEAPINSSFCRATLDLRGKKIAMQTINGNGCEFPRIAPRALTQAHQTVYMAGFTGTAAQMGLPDALVRLDIQTGAMRPFALPAMNYPSEPVFVPRQGGSAEDDGYVLSLVFDAQQQRTYLGIFAAQRPEQAPLAKAFFDQPLPTSFHGNFYPAMS